MNERRLPLMPRRRETAAERDERIVAEAGPWVHINLVFDGNVVCPANEPFDKACAAAARILNRTAPREGSEMSDIDREKAPHLPVPKNREEIDHAIRLAIDGHINLADHIDVWLLDLRAQARAAEDAGATAERDIIEHVWQAAYEAMREIENELDRVAPGWNPNDPLGSYRYAVQAIKAMPTPPAAREVGPGQSAPPTDFATADAWYDKHAELYRLELLEPRALVRFAWQQAALSSRESRAAGAWTETELAGAFVAAGAYENLARALARIAIAGPK